MAHEVVLEGCNPVPLASYLKALAVLRLVSEQADPDARGWWRNESFHLESRLDRDTLMRFFLYEYRPTPIIAPWNGGSGFYAHRKTASATLDSILRSATPRLKLYRDVIRQTLDIVEMMGLSEQPTDEAKLTLLAECRNRLPDTAVEWLDAVLGLTPSRLTFPPLLATGGTDGNLEFTNNFMQRLTDTFDVSSGQPTRLSEEWLRGALFGTPISGMVGAAVGQFMPGFVGGPNATAGFEGDSRVNPWDYILMIEGTLMFSASATKRLESSGFSYLSYPFTVLPSTAGHGSLDANDEGAFRAEMWLPLWSRPCLFRELAAVLREGRAQVDGRAARNGLDFARACAKLGINRGIDSFQRFSFLKRSGKSYLAVPLTRFWVRRRVEADLLDDLTQGGWLDRLARAAKTEGHGMQSAYRRIAESVFQLCQHGGATRVQALLCELGAVERLMASRPSLRMALEPLVLESGAWLQYAHDGSREFELAAGIAGLSWPGGPAVRAYFSPVDARRPNQWSREESTRVVWTEGDLVRNMIRLLERRLIDAGHPDWAKSCPDGKPLGGDWPVRLPTVLRFLQGAVETARVDALIWGLLPLTPRGLLKGATTGDAPPRSNGSPGPTQLRNW
ncbi:MAG: type I-U CRISPR-associated protein Csx17 [Alicyclobacillaceae bacterium]|nr:type I-U CRISPR-associated protein Csx17 [Alicyclobacillaceae bacterium]